MNKITEEFINILRNTVSLADSVQRARWKPGLTFFSGLLSEELKRICGYTPSPETPSLEERRKISQGNYSAYQKEISQMAPGELTYPEKFNWLDHNNRNYITPVRNQGFCSSCAAFGVVAAMETQIRIQNDYPVVKDQKEIYPLLSEAQLFFSSPGYSPVPGEGTHNNKTGWTVKGALEYSSKTGVIPAKSCPYDFDYKSKPLPEKWQETVTKTGNYRSLNSHREMKEWLSNKGPLITTMTVYIDFFLYKEGIYSYILGPELGGHCVCCIGYDDERKAWLCKNSWSEKWGEKGFFWVEYGSCGIDAEMWAIEDFSKIYTV